LQPAVESSGVRQHDGHKYGVLRNARDLAVYRVRNDGMLKRMKRWPVAIDEVLNASQAREGGGVMSGAAPRGAAAARCSTGAAPDYCWQLEDDVQAIWISCGSSVALHEASARQRRRIATDLRIFTSLAASKESTAAASRRS
jgi:hypothetical protein